MKQDASEFGAGSHLVDKGDAPASAVIGWSPALSLALSLVLHCAVAALAFMPGNAAPGAGGTEPEAIGIEIISSAVLDAMLSERAVAASAAALASAARDPGSEAAAARQTETELKPEKVEEPPLEIPLPDPEPDAPAVTEAKSEPKPEPAPSVESVEGGPSVAAVAHAKTAEERPALAAAQAGVVRLFLAGVRTRLAKNRPRSLRRKGTTIVTFAIRPSGELDYAKVETSSGVPALDQAALDAVRRSAPFQKPPDGMRSADLVFSVPYRFD